MEKHQVRDTTASAGPSPLCRPGPRVRTRAAFPAAEEYVHINNLPAPAAPPALAVAPGCPECMQRRYCLPEGLTVDEMTRLGRLFSGSRTVLRNDCLFRAGDSLKCLYVLRSGVMKLLCTASNGDEQVLGFCLPGDILGLEALGSETCTDSAVAIETATLCEIPIAPLERMCREVPRLQHRIHALFARQIVNSHATLTVVGKGKAEAGLASLLLDLAQRLKAHGYSGNEFNLCMSRTDIANYLGIAVETVSRTFTRLHRQGVLRVDKRNIVILKPDHLRGVAGETLAGGRGEPDYRVRRKRA